VGLAVSMFVDVFTTVNTDFRVDDVVAILMIARSRNARILERDECEI